MNIRECFPDWEEMKCGEWSKHGKTIRYGSGEWDFIEIGLYKEPSDGSETSESYTLHIFNGEEVAVCQTVDVGVMESMTTEEKWEEIYDVLDDMGVKYTNYCETEVLIEFWTDTAGQDIITEFNYDGTPEDFVKQFTERAKNYDVDEEVEIFVGMRGKNGVPNTVRELLDDCQEAKDTLMEIATKLQNAL